MRPEWLRAIAKASSALRFTANHSESMTREGREEYCSVAAKLTELENAISWGYVRSEIRATEQGNIAEEAFFDAEGNLIGYWAYGHYDPAHPFKG